MNVSAASLKYFRYSKKQMMYDLYVFILFHFSFPNVAPWAAGTPV